MLRSALTALYMISLCILSLIPCAAFSDDASESADEARLRKDGFVKRYDNDLAEVWVNEADNRMFVFHHDGSFEHVYFSHRTTLDTKGEPSAERFVDYIVLWEKDFKAVQVTDRYGIPYTGSELEQTDDGVSFIERFHGNKVTIRKNGRRRVEGPTGGYETGRYGFTTKTFDANGKAVNLYGYDKRAVNNDVLHGGTSWQLTEMVNTNPKTGEMSHWKLTDTDEKTGQQTWPLQNSADGKKPPLEGKHSVFIAADNSIAVRDSVDSIKAPPQGKAMESTTRSLQDGARVESMRIELPNGASHETVSVFASATSKTPAYSWEGTTHPGEHSPRSAVLTGSNQRYETKDGRLWVLSKDGRVAGFYTGTMRVLGDGTLYQTGHDADKDGRRLNKDGRPVPNKTFLTNTSGESLEITLQPNVKLGLGFQPPMIRRESGGDIAETINAYGQSTSFQYKPEARTEAGDRIIAGIRVLDGKFWKAGRLHYQPESGWVRDPSDRLHLELNQRTGQCTWQYGDFLGPRLPPGTALSSRLRLPFAAERFDNQLAAETLVRRTAAKQADC